MPNEKTATDQFVRNELDKFGVDYDEQTSSNPDIKKSLKGASKTEKNGVAQPDFVVQLDKSNENYLLIIEDKFDNDKLIDENNNKISEELSSIQDYAVNGAVHYAKHIVEKSELYDEVIAVGVTGDKNNHLIQPAFVSKEKEPRLLPQLTSLQELHPDKFEDWYSKTILGKESKEQQQIFELKKIAAELHEDLRNYAALEGENKATVVSAILLALNEQAFKIESLTGNRLNPRGETVDNDGKRILKAIKDYIKNEGIMPQDKVNIVLNKFAFLETNVKLNEKNDTLEVTPLHYFARKLENNVLDHFKSNTNYDILGNFYGEFVKYGGSDGNSLGIVLTPHHITDLMVKLIDIQPSDTVLDPACGTGAFLISAMNIMVAQTTEKYDKQKKSATGSKLKRIEEEEKEFIKSIKQNQLLGIEMQEKMFTVATTNMILRGDGKSNLQLADMFTIIRESERQKRIKQLKNDNEDLLRDKTDKNQETADSKIEQNEAKIQELEKTNSVDKVNKILFNPPYSQGKTDKKLTEINFIKHALDLLEPKGKLAVIVPQSTMVGKSKGEKQFKKDILNKHTLELVITLNKDTFHGVGTNPVIAVFTAGQKHPDNKKVKFVNFEDDGFVVRKHIGLIDNGTAKEKQERLLKLINGEIDDYKTKAMVETSIKHEDEWLHSFFYFNDEIPSEADFEKTIADYLSFQFDMYAHGRGYLFRKIKSTKKNINYRVVNGYLKKLSKDEEVSNNEE